MTILLTVLGTALLTYYWTNAKKDDKIKDLTLKCEELETKRNADLKLCLEIIRKIKRLLPDEISKEILLSIEKRNNNV